MRLSLYFIFLILALSPHDSRDDRKNIYKAPSEFLSLEKINQLKDSETEISELTNLLNVYYSQFTEDKRIQNEKEKGIRFKDRTDNVSSEFKNSNGIFPIPSDVNSIRKYQNAYRLKNSETNLVRDSNLLFTAHYRLANLYKDAKNINKALESYIAAIRYRDFSITEEKLFNTPELLDSDEKNLQSHKALKDSLEKSKLDLKQKKDEYYKTLSEYSKMKLSESEANAKVSTLKSEIDTLEANLKDSETNYADSLKNNFKKFLDNKSMLDSNFLLDYAKTVYSVESNNKNRDKVTNKYREYYNGVFADTDNNKNRKFEAYNNILQFAIRLNPKNSEAILLLAEESKSSGKTDLAIGFFQKYLAIEKADSISVYKSLAALYSQQKKNVLASFYYDKILSEAKEEDLLKQDPYLYYQMAVFFFDKLGDSSKGKTYSEIFLKNLSNLRKEEEEKKKNDDKFGIGLREVIRRLKSEFNSNIIIAEFQRKNKYPEEELIFLNKSYSAYQSILGYINFQKEKMAEQKKSVNDIKFTLLNSTSAESLEIFREEEEKLFDLKTDFEFLLIENNSLQRVNLLLKLIQNEEENRNYKKVKQYYNEILLIGTDSEIHLALKNLRRIEQIEADGYSRKKLLF